MAELDTHTGPALIRISGILVASSFNLSFFIGPGLRLSRTTVSQTRRQLIVRQRTAWPEDTGTGRLQLPHFN